MSEQYRSHFDPDKPDTAGDKLIHGQWDKHSEDIYQILAVLTVVTENTLSPSQHSHKQYTKKGHYQALQGRKV